MAEQATHNYHPIDKSTERWKAFTDAMAKITRATVDERKRYDDKLKHDVIRHEEAWQREAK